jgi:hypothetical protein
LTFLVAGSTSLPKDIYVDYAMTNLAPNPLLLDASGFAPQYFMESGLYKIIVKTSTGSIVATRDYIEGSAAGEVVPDDHKVKVDQFDTAEYLVDKVVSGAGVDVINVTAATRKLQIDSKGWVKTNSSDEAMGTLADKISAGNGIDLNAVDTGAGDYVLEISTDASQILDGKVKVSIGDSTAEYLQDKIVDSDTVTWDTVSVLGVQTVRANVDTSSVTGDRKVICSIDDDAPDYLEGKIVAGTGNVTVTTESSGQDQQLHINVYGPGDAGTGGYVSTMYVANAIHTLAPHLIVRSELIVLFVPTVSTYISLASKFGAFIAQGGTGTLRFTLRDSSYRLIANSIFVNNPSPQVFLELLCGNIQNPITQQQLSSYRLDIGGRYYLGINWDANGIQLLGDDAVQNNNIQPYSAYKVDNLNSTPQVLTGGGESKLRPFVRLLTPEGT